MVGEPLKISLVSIESVTPVEVSTLTFPITVSVSVSLTALGLTLMVTVATEDPATFVSWYWKV